MQPFESQFASLAGIGPLRAVEIICALATQMQVNESSIRQRSCITIEQNITLAADMLLSQSEVDLDQTVLCREQMHQILGAMNGDWVPTRDQLADKIGNLSSQEWGAFSDAIGLTPKSRTTIAEVVDIQDRPLFFLDSERAFFTHEVACFDAVFTFFDNLARNNPSMRDNYGLNIAAWMESEIEAQLRRLFPSSSVLRNACFTDPDNPGGETEADVVVIWWPFLIVVDAKGKRVATAALRGSRTELKKTLKKNIKDAFDQSCRVARVLERDGKVQFKEKSTGRVIVVAKDRLRRIMPISVTLQNLSGIATQLAVTQRLDLFKDDAYPWCVCVDDLDVITRFAGAPDVLLHYIERRTSQQGIEIGLWGDELDIFGQYLGNRLHPSVYEGRKEISEHDTGSNSIVFNGGDEIFEPYYAAEWNKEPQPSGQLGLDVPKPIQDLLAELRTRTDDDNARWIAFALLSFSDAALNRLASALQDIRLKQAEMGRILRTTIREGDVVINVLAQRSLTEADFFWTAALRSRLEHYRHRPRATLTLGIDQRNTIQPFEIAQWLEGQWEHDPELEKLLAKDQEQPRGVRLPPGKQKIGRNDPCPCGSGKKFKRCCISRMEIRRTE